MQFPSPSLYLHENKQGTVSSETFSWVMFCFFYLTVTLIVADFVYSYHQIWPEGYATEFLLKSSIRGTQENSIFCHMLFETLSFWRSDEPPNLSAFIRPWNLPISLDMGLKYMGDGYADTCGFCHSCWLCIYCFVVFLIVVHCPLSWYWGMQPYKSK